MTLVIKPISGILTKDLDMFGKMVHSPLILGSLCGMHERQRTQEIKNASRRREKTELERHLGVQFTRTDDEGRSVRRGLRKR